MPIVADLRDDLLSLAGLESVSHGPSGLEARIISDIRRAQEHIGDSNPAAFYSIRPNQAELVRAPVALNVTVTEGSKAITINSAGFVSSWMPGCSILISGDSTLNMLENEGSASAPALAKPYMGTTGTTTATIYHDWILLPAGIRGVLEPVTLDRNRRLTPAVSVAEFEHRWGTDYGDTALGWQKAVGDPRQWLPFAQTVMGSVRSGVMLDALSSTARTLNFTAKKELFAAVTSLSDTRTTLVPEGKDHEILLPVARWFFASYQHCSVPKAELQPDYELAMQKARALGVVHNRRKAFAYSSER